ncbi:CBS domain-containing protein [Irregularibacter muris]|uniref:CBS domain-containing protein n=1 Tax=Irregularibacter muris TaxID=1796619 RepID=A0AAE3HE38_9FIRM|nr:CBS domain-containing protein [Irregularibacter muris]MCR1898866.1 CBS domain-containing protein [Irregularibacter muris]
MYIKDIMIKDVITVKESDTVEKCAKLLSTHRLSGLPVLDEQGKVTGIITEGDLIKRAAKLKAPTYLQILGGIIYLDSPKDLMNEIKKTMGQLAKDVMTEKVITINPDKKIEDAATILVHEKIKRLPVIDEKGNLVGIVSRRDIMNHLFHTK